MNRLFAAVFLLFVCAAVPAAAEPTFFIESIRVDGARRTSSRVAIAESKLVAGREYSETQLRDAISRVQRLPFLVHSDLRLEKGEVRGHYVLVIVVEEMKPLFVDYMSTFQTFGVDYIRFTGVDPVTGFPQFQNLSILRFHPESTTFGARMFVTPRGMIAASTSLNDLARDDAGDNRYGLSYTQYELFGTRASIAALIQYRDHQFDYSQFGFGGRLTTSFGDHLLWDVSAAVPLAGNHALLATWHREQRPILINPDGEDKFVRKPFDQTSLSWRYDSTNDVYFPTRGAFAEAGVDSERRTRSKPVSFGFIDAETFWHHDIVSHARKYWPLTERQSVSAGSDVIADGGLDFFTVAVRAGYSADLWSASRPSRGEFRFEMDAGENFLGGGRRSASARAGLVFRSEWGLLRLTATYAGRGQQ